MAILTVILAIIGGLVCVAGVLAGAVFLVLGGLKPGDVP